MNKFRSLREISIALTHRQIITAVLVGTVIIVQLFSTSTRSYDFNSSTEVYKSIPQASNNRLRGLEGKIESSLGKVNAAGVVNSTNPDTTGSTGLEQKITSTEQIETPSEPPSNSSSVTEKPAEEPAAKKNKPLSNTPSQLHIVAKGENRQLKQQTSVNISNNNGIPPIGMDRYDADILLAVVTSRKSLSSRVVAIRESWGHPSNIPSNVHIRYFVGNGTEPTLDLLRFAGLENSDELVVMAEVEDDEYPPVKKKQNMLKRLQDMVYEMESSAVEIKYIMKVDDDTYVNFDGLLKFLAHRDPTEVHQYWGSPGIGAHKDSAGIKKGGLKKPYCMGGPGFVFSSRATLEGTANGVDVCVREADASPQRKYVWWDDVIIGMCITRQTGIGCRKSGLFRHNYKGALDKSIVTMHPFKRAGEMARQHSRFGKPQNKAMKQQNLKATSKEQENDWLCMLLKADE